MEILLKSELSESMQHGVSATTVEYNYFSNIDSDFEVITVKSSGNFIRHNVVDSSRGVLSLRHGSGNHVYGNFILGRGKDGTGGIWVSGPDHTIASNYISNINPGAVWPFAGIAFNGGSDEIEDKGDGTPYYKFEKAHNISAVHNTIVDSGASIVFGNGKTLPPREIELMNNIVLRGKGSAIQTLQMGPNIKLGNNLIFGATVSLKLAGIRLLDPKMIRDAQGIERPTSQSPVIGAILTAASTLPDMDGQQRVLPSDIGADEVMVGKVAQGPISACRVGPSTDSYAMNTKLCDERVADAAPPKPPVKLLVN